MLDSVTKKVMQDLFTSPLVLVPAMGGVTCLAAAWANEGPVTLLLAGLAGVVVAVGSCATKYIFGVDKMTEDAFKFVQDKERKEHEKELDALETKLNGGRGIGIRRVETPKAVQLLRTLRNLYDHFHTQESGKFGPAQQMIADKVEQLYQACIKQLEHSCELYAAAYNITPGNARNSILTEREKVVSEVASSVDMLGKSIEQFYLIPKGGDGDLKEAKQELEQTLEAARSAQVRMNGGDISEKDMREYEQEGKK